MTFVDFEHAVCMITTQYCTIEFPYAENRYSANFFHFHNGPSSSLSLSTNDHLMGAIWVKNKKKKSSSGRKHKILFPLSFTFQNSSHFFLMKNLLNFIQPHPHTTLYIPSQSISNSLTTKTITSLPITKPSSHFSTKNFSLAFPTQKYFQTRSIDL